MTRLTLALILAATTAHATPWSIPDGNGGFVDNPECSSQECHDTGVPDKPSQPQGDTDRDPTPITTEQHYGFCCTDQHTGKTRFHTAWLRNPTTAKAQCNAKPVKATCPDSIQRQIDAGDGQANET